MRHFWWNLPQTDYFRDECIVRQFGETANENHLLDMVMESPMSKALDAFIECPRQMIALYFIKIMHDKTDEFMIFVRDSGKVAEFFAAFHSITDSDDPKLVEAVRKQIYSVAFIRGFPTEFYLDELKKEEQDYHIALLEKASLAKTPESKALRTQHLTEYLASLEESAANALTKIDDMDELIDDMEELIDDMDIMKLMEMDQSIDYEH